MTVALAAAVGLLVAAGCTATAPVAPTPGPTSSVSQGPGDNEPTGTATPPPPQSVTAVPSVSRSGRSGAVAAPTVPPSAPASMADGVVVTLTRVEQGTTSGKGPGVIVGQPQTTVTVTVRNGSTTAVDLNQVVVSVTYGKTSRFVAPPVYHETTRDFTGSLAPGASADAVHAFSVPTDQLDAVTIAVDLDDRHDPVIFDGALR